MKFDGSGEYLTEAKSRHPDLWWPKGTVLTRAHMNQSAFILVRRSFEDWSVVTVDGAENATGYKVQ